jgi:two-component system NtrC family sensor kinase
MTVRVEPELHAQKPTGRPLHPAYRSMGKELQFRYSAVVLGVLTAAAISLAVINFRKEAEFQVPHDGVWWMESNERLRAERVSGGSPGDLAGIRAGDELVAISGQPIASIADLNRQLHRSGVWSKAGYSLLRNHVRVETSVVLAPVDRSLNNGLRVIALVYLGIGLYVLLRRWTAPKSTHFYVFCLVSFVFYSYRYVGNWSEFDFTIYWGNVLAWLLQPALFLHFALTFPETKAFAQRRPWLLKTVYAPAALLLLLHIVVLKLLPPSERLRWNLDRLQMLYLAVFFLIAALVLVHSYRRVNTPLLRQQMKWVTRGTLLAIGPFTVFYVIPYLNGALPTAAMKMSVLSLIFLPLTFGYAIVRYRLMDVDLIFKRGMAYTLATAAIVGMYFGAVGLLAELFMPNSPALARLAWLRLSRLPRCCSSQSRTGFKNVSTASFIANATTTGKR